MRPDLAERDFSEGVRAALARRRIGLVTIMMSEDESGNRTRRYVIDDNGTKRIHDYRGVIALARRPTPEHSQHHTRRRSSMNSYRFAISYCDRADDALVGFVLVDVMSDSAEHASRELEDSKHDRGWLLTTFGADRDSDIDGIIVGAHVHVQMTPPCVADDDREGRAS